MIRPDSMLRTATRMWLLAIACSLACAGGLHAQQPPASAGAAPQAIKTWTTDDDHQQMLGQLGIKALRPGPSGNEAAPNHANVDEALANPFPDYPEVLRLKNGKAVTNADTWWKRRRPEIVEDFEREVLGRVPRAVPKVTWTVTGTAPLLVGTQLATGTQLNGHVDNAACPAISVDIQATLVLPDHVGGPVPVLIMFGRSGLSPTPMAMPAGRGMPPADPTADPQPTEQLLAAGWGYVSLNPASVQADNGAGLTRGIIGLVNKGQPRKPDDWGALRAWAWGASRVLDYLETLPSVDAKKVGIEGVSRYGKAALVTMAFDTRLAVVLIGSSGEGGTKPHRRNFGEAVENLTGSGEYHWMAGNFLKYGASDATFGSKNAGDLPVDSHELIALCAPRLTFVSYGIPEKGDARWLDQQGSFMATIAAGRVFRLLGAKDLGQGDAYKTAKMPPVNTGLLDGHLAWRQHDGGHTDRPNYRYFIPWASRWFGYTAPPAPPLPAAAAFVAAPRTDENSLKAHEQLLAKKTQGRIDAYFMGDSITRRWGALDYPQLLEHWKQTFFGWNAGDFGWGADMVENVLWRVQNGELDGVNPKVMILLAGTNNVGRKTPGVTPEAKAAEITRGLEAVMTAMRAKAPSAPIIVTAIFPRNDDMAHMAVIDRVNTQLAALADGRSIRFLNVNDKLAGPDGVLFDGMMNADKLHPALKGYQVWADGLKPILTEILGPPAATDQAPPPTGDPKALAQPQK
jgi:lysophospholipase L1-like esterase